MSIVVGAAHRAQRKLVQKKENDTLNGTDARYCAPLNTQQDNNIKQLKHIDKNH